MNNQRNKDAADIRDLLQRCGLQGCESNLDEVIIPLIGRTITMQVVGSKKRNIK